MPPLPKPKTGSSAKGSSRPSATDSGERERTRSSSAGYSSRSQTKLVTLQQQLATMYLMLGAAVRPFGRFYPVMEPVGNNLQAFADDAAKAWIDLAAKDARVLKALESLLEASVWGNVIGIHLAIFASAIPGGGAISAMAGAPTNDADMMEAMRTEGERMGMTDEEIRQAQAMAAGGGMGTPVPDVGSGGPGDTIRTGGQPVPPPPPATSRSGIVTPEELGATVADVGTVMPADTSPPNGTGAISN